MQRKSGILAVLVVILAALLATLPARATETPPPEQSCHALTGNWAPVQRVCISTASYYGDVCDAIERLALRWSLPTGYFARLIWQESRFDPNAVSPVGAEGIAQFMPSTARLRGLTRSFDPAEALTRSAEYLAFLRDRFGNLGLAAAAYNGGEGAVSGWLAGTRGLAAETRNYVRFITGLSVDDWRVTPWLPPNMALSRTDPFNIACRRLAEDGRPVALRQFAIASSFAWGVQIAQHASTDTALRTFERIKARFSSLLGEETPIMVSVRNPAFGSRPRPTVFVGRASEDEARDLCRRLTQAGGVCLVRKN